MICRLVLIAMLAASCVTAPARVDLRGLVKRLGPVDARHELEVRIVADPKDIAARLALAKLCEEQGRPSQALAQLEAVLALGGPIGTRWHDEDEQRFARLLAQRGRARTARGAPTAPANLSRARRHGAKVRDDELVAARTAAALVQVRHIDANERATALATLERLGKLPRDPRDLGVWLWSIGAKRAAWEALDAWHTSAARVPVPARPEALQRAYLVARAWWTPYDGAPPPASELVGPERCRSGGCNVWDLVQNAPWSDAIAAVVDAAPPPRRTSDPQEVYAWLAITLAQTLRGDGTWAALFASRVDVAAIAVDRLPAGARAAFALATGRDDDAAGAPGPATPHAVDRSVPGRFLAAAVAAKRGAARDEVQAILGDLATTPDGAALLAVVDPATPADDPSGPARAPAGGGRVAHPYAAGVARYVEARTGERRADGVRAILEAYARDPASADRVARDVVAESVDAAVGHAVVGAVFDAIEDPARARASWQAAVDASPGEPAYVRGLAEAVARASDPDAALVFATQAAAASGDPAPVWTAIARALHAHGFDAHALEAARYAIDLASGETIAPALEIAIAASETLGRTGQVAELRARRGRVAPPVAPVMEAGEAGDAWNPRDLASRVAALADPARREAAIAGLVRIAGDREGERARAAIRALRAVR